MATFRDQMRRGNALVWLSGGILALSVLMIGGLVGFIAVRGLGFFWPQPLVKYQTSAGPVLGMVVDQEAPKGSEPGRIQLKVGNRDLYGQDFRWYQEDELSQAETPADALLVERLEYGAFLGRIQSLQRNSAVVAQGRDAAREVLSQLPRAQQLQKHIRAIEKNEVGSLNTRLEDLRLERKQAAARENTAALDAREKQLQEAYAKLQQQLETLRTEAKLDLVVLESIDGKTKEIPLSSVVRIVPANALGLFGKAGIYCSRLWEFVAGDPRESNTEGGIFPAIFGTVMMVLLMSILVVPLGVMASLYLREYARDGWLVRAIRVAVNNLAGVPSIVFGVFGLGFFVYTVGGTIDRLFYAEKLPTPTYGTGGILWAALTLALLTVPVVIVSTEEALAAVPRSQREASLALGATKWQTLWNIALPGALPGILTGLILAMARGAGEVAPLMLTGVVKLAPSMPLDGSFPFLHLDRKFMHLGFHIYDVGFQSPNSEAAKPMVFMTAMLLLVIVVFLNLAAISLRRRLRARLGGSTF